MARLPAKSVVAICKGGLQPLHPRRQIPLRGLQCKMEMIAHHHICMQHPFRPDAGLEQAGLKRFAGPFLLERPDPAVAPVDHMVNCPGKFQSQFTRHAVDDTTRSRQSQVKD